MMAVTTLARVLETLGALVYGGPLIAFALLLTFRGRISSVRDEDVVRVYRAFGPGFGLAMGAMVFGALWRYPRLVNPGVGLPEAFSLRWGNSVEQLSAIQAILFVVLWVNYIALEIWTLEPCRLMDKDGQVTDRPTYAAATARVARHAAFNAVLFVVITVLHALGARP
jgi:nitric oxide reductase large subunit